MSIIGPYAKAPSCVPKRSLFVQRNFSRGSGRTCGLAGTPHTQKHVVYRTKTKA